MMKHTSNKAFGKLKYLRKKVDFDGGADSRSSEGVVMMLKTNYRTKC
jgi:hypothetical protein